MTDNASTNMRQVTNASMMEPTKLKSTNKKQQSIKTIFNLWKTVAVAQKTNNNAQHPGATAEGRHYHHSLLILLNQQECTHLAIPAPTRQIQTATGFDRNATILPRAKTARTTRVHINPNFPVSHENPSRHLQSDKHLDDRRTGAYYAHSNTRRESKRNLLAPLHYKTIKLQRLSPSNYNGHWNTNCSTF